MQSVIVLLLRTDCNDYEGRLFLYMEDADCSKSIYGEITSVVKVVVIMYSERMARRLVPMCLRCTEGRIFKYASCLRPSWQLL